MSGVHAPAPLRVLIAGGNSGIGLQTARELAAEGHQISLLGRDAAKGKSAVDSLRDAPGDVSFLQADLSTHDGVRNAAERILYEYGQLDALVHTTGLLIDRDERTVDGLHPMFAVSYLSRYHLTQLLLPALRQSLSPRVVMMTAKVSPDTPLDYAQFPHYRPFNFGKMRLPIQVANHHYAAHLAYTEPGFSTAVINAGAAKTDILRDSPWPMRAGAALLGPFIFNSVATSAHNVVQAASGPRWDSAVYWDKPGQFEHRTPIQIDSEMAAETARRSLDVTNQRLA